MLKNISYIFIVTLCIFLSAQNQAHSAANGFPDTDLVFKIFMNTCATNISNPKKVRDFSYKNKLKNASPELIQRLFGNNGEAWLMSTANGTRMILGIGEPYRCMLLASNIDHVKTLSYMDKLIQGTKTNYPEITVDKSDQITGDEGSQIHTHIWQVSANDMSHVFIYMLHLPLSPNSPNYPYTRFSTALAQNTSP